ncbi:hypothetical protein CICLE_v100257113mg, partial [Citrus x clementina]
ATLNLGHTFGH